MLRRKRNRRRTLKRLNLETLESRALLHAEGSLSGYVYIDANSDGQRDESEFGVPGVVVRLSEESDSSSERSTLTDDLGFYSFDELEPGTYEVSERQSSALSDGEDSTPMTEAVSTNDRFSNVVLADDENPEENNFGERGLRAEFLSVLWFLASTPPAHQMLRETVAIAEDLAGNSTLAESIRAGGGQIPDDEPTDHPTNASPTVTDDDYAVEENQTLTVPASSGVLENDSDPDGDALTASLISQADNGTVSLNSDGSFTYIPDNNFFGDDTFTYSASDGEASNTGSVTVTVTPGPPNTFMIDENSPVGTVVGQITPDNPGDSLIFEIADPSAGQVFQISDDVGELTVADSTALDFEITPSFTFGVNVTNGSTSTVIATVNLRNVNEDSPTAQGDSYDIDEDGVLTVPVSSGVLSNDTDNDGDTLTAAVVEQPDHGDLVFNEDGSFTYEPDDNFSGTDQFTYEAADADFSDNATVTVTVNPVNDVPVADANTYTTEEDQVLTISAASGVLVNDMDADGDSLTAQLADQAINGVVDLEDDGSFVYTPDSGFSGTDSFTYRASDGDATSNVATVTINVSAANRPPSAADDDYSVGENAVLSVGDSHSLLANDSDPDGDTLTAVLVSQASNGVVELNQNGTFTYTPSADFSGNDSFTYRASDGVTSSAAATARITVTPAGDGNELFGPVTPGSFEAPDVLGTRTDLVPGAPPLSADHVDGDIDYTGYSNPPTYGPHHGFDPDGTDVNPGVTPRPTGIYTSEQPDEDLIHNLEHGHVWISYNPNLIGNADLDALEQLVRDGSPNANGGGVGVILTPRAANESAITLASWARLLTLDDFDSDTIRSFVETNRGKAPEGFLTP